MKKKHGSGSIVNINHLHAKGAIAVAVLLVLIALPIFNSPTGNVVAGCHDTDGGINYAIKGYVNVDPQIRSDYCIGESVVEFYCESGEAKLIINNCPKYCIGGRCIE